MAIEIERKFLVDHLPFKLMGSCEPQLIRQGYLILEPERELRLRQKGRQYYLTSKSGVGMVREENEKEVDQSLFTLLWPFTESRRLEKNRYTFTVDTHVYEIDEYVGTLSGLRVLEVEFTSEESALAFTMPDFCHREVTGDSRYKNAMLAKMGLP